MALSISRWADTLLPSTGARLMIDRMHVHHRTVVRWGFLGLLLFAGLPIICSPAHSQDSALVPDASLAIPALHFDSTGALAIQASASSSQHDFDFLVGNWQ